MVRGLLVGLLISASGVASLLTGRLEYLASAWGFYLGTSFGPLLEVIGEFGVSPATAVFAGFLRSERFS